MSTLHRFSVPIGAPGDPRGRRAAQQALGGAGSLRGAFEHIFTYGPNGDLTHEMAPSPNCAVGCDKPSVRRAYATKYVVRRCAETWEQTATEG